MRRWIVALACLAIGCGSGSSGTVPSAVATTAAPACAPRVAALPGQTTVTTTVTTTVPTGSRAIVFVDARGANIDGVWTVDAAWQQQGLAGTMTPILESAAENFSARPVTVTASGTTSLRVCWAGAKNADYSLRLNTSATLDPQTVVFTVTKPNLP